MHTKTFWGQASAHGLWNGWLRCILNFCEENPYKKRTMWYTIRKWETKNMAQYEQAVAMWQSKNIYTVAELAEAMNGHSIAFAYHSGNIENPHVTYNDTCEIFGNSGVTSYIGDLRTLFEICNAKEANEYFLNAFGQKLPLDEVLLKELHRLLTQNTYDTRRYQLDERPGKFQKHDYVTGREEVGAFPEDVAEELNELLDDGQDIPKEQALIAVAFSMPNLRTFIHSRTGTAALADLP